MLKNILDYRDILFIFGGILSFIFTVLLAHKIRFPLHPGWVLLSLILNLVIWEVVIPAVFVFILCFKIADWINPYWVEE